MKKFFCEHRLIFWAKGPEHAPQPEENTNKPEVLTKAEKVIEGLKGEPAGKEIQELVKRLMQDGELDDVKDVQQVSDRVFRHLAGHFDKEEQAQLSEALPTTHDAIVKFLVDGAGIMTENDFVQMRARALLMRSSRQDVVQNPIGRPGATQYASSVVHNPIGRPNVTQYPQGPSYPRSQADRSVDIPSDTNAIVRQYMGVKQGFDRLTEQRYLLTGQYRKLHGRNRLAYKQSYLAMKRQMSTIPYSNQINGLNTVFKGQYGMNITEMAKMLAGLQPPSGRFDQAKAELAPQVLEDLAEMGRKMGKKYERDQLNAERMDQRYRSTSSRYRSSFARSTRSYEPGRGQALSTMARWNRMGRGPLADRYFDTQRLRRSLGVPKNGFAPESDVRFRSHIASAQARGMDVYTRGNNYAYIDRTGAMKRFLNRKNSNLNPSYRSAQRNESVSAMRFATIDTNETHRRVGDHIGTVIREKQLESRSGLFSVAMDTQGILLREGDTMSVWNKEGKRVGTAIVRSVLGTDAVLQMANSTPLKSYEGVTVQSPLRTDRQLAQAKDDNADDTETTL